MADEDTTHPTDAEQSESDEASQESTSSESTPTGIEILKRERDDYYDRLLRQTAEFDNYRKRIDRERRAHADQAVVDLLLELLLVVDDFDRALTVEAKDKTGAYRKGIELIHSKLHAMLR